MKSNSENIQNTPQTFIIRCSRSEIIVNFVFKGKQKHSTTLH